MVFAFGAGRTRDAWRWTALPTIVYGDSQRHRNAGKVGLRSPV